jgi:hypothetical protein
MLCLGLEFLMIDNHFKNRVYQYLSSLVNKSIAQRKTTAYLQSKNKGIVEIQVFS